MSLAKRSNVVPSGDRLPDDWMSSWEKRRGPADDPKVPFGAEILCLPAGLSLFGPFPSNQVIRRLGGEKGVWNDRSAYFWRAHLLYPVSSCRAQPSSEELLRENKTQVWHHNVMFSKKKKKWQVPPGMGLSQFNQLVTLSLFFLINTYATKKTIYLTKTHK